MKYFTSLCFCLIFATLAAAENQVQLEGYVFAEDNSGFIKRVAVLILDDHQRIVQNVTTDENGFFSVQLKKDKTYQLKTQKKGFKQEVIPFNTHGLKEATMHLSIPLKRADGFIFEATLADWRPEESFVQVDAVTEATIEIYNNTKKKSELSLKGHPSHTFAFFMEQGNHYTILVRKEGYFNKRIEANVAVNGCILCFEGLGKIRPGVSDNLTENNTQGTLGANISLQRIELDKNIKIENIYYDVNSAKIRKDAALELDKMVSILKDNPHITIELSSHTDSRGHEKHNQKLSQARAESAVAYIVSQGINKNRLTAKGYGESQLVNRCKNGVSCGDEEHQENRRTAFKVTDIQPNQLANKSLESIIEAEQFDKAVEELQSETVYVAPKTPQKAEKTSSMTVSTVKNNVVAKGSSRTTKIKNQVSQQSVVVSKPNVQKTSPQVSPTEKKENFEIEVAYIFANYDHSDKAKQSPYKIGNKQAKVSKLYHIQTQPGNLSTEAELMQINQTAPKTIKTPAATIFKHSSKAKRIETGYTGYKIELLNSKEELANTHELFKKMGGVEADKTVYNTFSYMIGSFKTRKGAEHFLKTVIINRFADAKVIAYRKGKRKRK